MSRFTQAIPRSLRLLLPCLFLISLQAPLPAAGATPFFSITAPPVITNASTPVVLTYLSNIGGTGTITNFTWAVGDGRIISAPGLSTFTNIFDFTNVYTVTLTILFDSGDSGTASQNVTVSAYQVGSLWNKISEPMNMNSRVGGAYWSTPAGILAAAGAFNSGNSAALSTYGSENGVGWMIMLSNPPFPPRAFPAYTAGMGKLWMLGGLKTDGVTRTNDVWSSGDGLTWQPAAPAPWMGRSGHQAVFFRGRLWVMGGASGNGGPGLLTNDVWSSVDGNAWDLVTNAAPWAGREFFTATVFLDRIVLLAGRTNSGPMFGTREVWFSPDGTNWVLANPLAPFGPRAGHAATVAEGALWMTGGMDGVGLKRDVWFSLDGGSWRRATGNPPWRERAHHGLVYFQGQLLSIGGATNFAFADTPEVWSTRLGATALVQAINTNYELNAGRWRLVGLPITNAVANVVEVFSNLGASEIWTWDPFAMTNGPLMKYVRPFGLIPNRGYWLLSDFPMNLKASGTPPSEPAFALLIGGGWNLVANPFSFPIDRDSMRITGSPSNYISAVALTNRPDILDGESIHVYSAQGLPGYVRIQSNHAIPPGAGFWIWAHSNVFLAMPPTVAANPVPQAYFGLTPPPAAPPAAAGGVSLQIFMQSGEQADGSILHLAPNAAPRATLKPPAPRGGASLNFSSGVSQAAEQVLPLAPGIQRIPFVAAGGRPGGSTTLSWSADAAGGQQLFLRDLATGALRSMNAAGSFSYVASSMGLERKLELVVAPRGTAVASIMSFSLGEAIAFPNPLPAGGELSLRFTLDRSAKLSLELRDALGRIRLRRETSAPGDAFQPTTWRVPTLSEDGQALPPGWYAWRLGVKSEAGESIQSTGRILIEGKQ